MASKNTPNKTLMNLFCFHIYAFTDYVLSTGHETFEIWSPSWKILNPMETNGRSYDQHEFPNS